MYDIISSEFFDSVNIVKEAHILVPTHPPQPFPTHIPVEVPDNFNGDISSLSQQSTDQQNPSLPENPNLPQDAPTSDMNGDDDSNPNDTDDDSQQPMDDNSDDGDDPNSSNGSDDGSDPRDNPSESDAEQPADLVPLKKYILYQKLKELKRKIENNQYNFSSSKDYDNITFELNILLSNYQIFNSEQISNILSDFEQKLLVYGIPNNNDNENEDIDNNENEDNNNEMMNDNLNEQ